MGFYRWIARIVAFVASMIPLSVYAAIPITFPTGTIPAISSFVSLAVSILHMMTWVVFFYLNILLSPTFIFDLDKSGGGSFMEMLNQIWMLSRDLVNVVFAFALIAAAVITVVSSKKDFIVNHWKNFVMAVILVNFSWFFPRVVIDVANVTTAAIYGIPSLLSSECKTTVRVAQYMEGCTAESTDDETPMWSCPCVYINDAEMFMSDSQYKTYQSKSMKDEGWECRLGSILCIQKKKLDPKSVASHSAILSGLVVNHARLQTIADVPTPKDGSSISQLLGFIMREALLLLFHVLLLFPLLALLVAFIIRIPVLWLTIAFMPFYFMKFVVPGRFAEYPDKLMSYFLKAAFLPALVAIPLSVGFVLINAGSQLTFGSLKQIKIHLLDDVSDLWSILWILISMGVIWVGVFAVLEKMDIMGKGAGAIQSFGKSLGGIVMKLPLSLPILPGGKSVLALPQAAANINRGLSQGQSPLEAFKQSFSPTPNGKTQIDEAAKKYAKDTSNLNALNGKISDLTLAIKNGDTTKRDQALGDIRNQWNIAVDQTNPESTLRELASRLRTHGADPAVVGNIDSNLDSLRRELDAKQTPPTPAP